MQQITIHFPIILFVIALGFMANLKSIVFISKARTNISIRPTFSIPNILSNLKKNNIFILFFEKSVNSFFIINEHVTKYMSKFRYIYFYNENIHISYKAEYYFIFACNNDMQGYIKQKIYI
jgi:hypothetical protein